MDDVWSWAIGTAAICIMSGLAGAGLLYMALTKNREDDRVYRDSARSLAILLFVGFTIIGLVLAAAIVNRDSFDDVPGDLVDMLPDVVVALLIVVTGSALALAAGSYTTKSLAATSQRAREQAAAAVRIVVTGAAIVVALAQLGVNTTVLVIAGGALLFGFSLAAALLVGLGGRDMASEVAAGRYLARMLVPGDQVELSLPGGERLSGTVAALHPASVEIETGPGMTCHVVNSQVISGSPRIQHS